MSLLNDVLKDLDKLKRRTPKPSPEMVHSVNRLFNRLPQISPWLLTPFICCGLFLLFMYCHLPKHSVTKQSAPAVTTDNSSLIESSLASVPLVTASIKPESLVSKVPTIVFPIVVVNSVQETNPTIASNTQDEENLVKKIFSPPSDTEWYDEQFNIALEAIQQGNEDIAETTLTQLLNRFPNAVNARETLAKLYLVQGQYPAAQETLDEGLRLQPNYLAFNTLKARLLFEQNHPKQALRILQKFRPNIHKHTDFYGLLAAVLQSLDQLNESGNLYKMLVELEPDNGQYWLGYGIALEHKHEKIQAISAYAKVAGQYDAEPAIRTFAEKRLKRLQG